MRLLAALALLVLAIPTAWAQDSLDVTFRFLPDLTAPTISPVVRAFAPGTMPNGTVNDWGPNASGTIRPGAASEMTFDSALNEYRYTQRLAVGSTHQYKIHYHTNASASGSPGYGGVWIADPLNPIVVGNDGNSQMMVADPMLFQLAREQDGGDVVNRVSASIFASDPVTSVTFEVNGVERDGLGFYDAATNLFSYDLPTGVAPGSQFKITATTAKGTVTSEIGLRPPTVVDQARPAGLQDGITYQFAGTDDLGKVSFSLFAPGKDYVYLLSPQNDWKPSDQFLMKRDSVNADSVYFWIETTGALGEPFQYFVDGLIRVADPYSPLVLFPGEERYPNGKTSDPVGVLNRRTTQMPIMLPQGCSAEDIANYQRPEQEDLVIYELLLRDFLGDHSMRTLADSLDYLSDLGVTAIELMPISEFDGDESWGYNPAFHLALDKYYGTPEDLDYLVAAAHCRGMAVILDVVYNHATGQSPLIRLYNQSATGSPAALPSADSPYANVTTRHPFNVFNDLNHDSPATRYWLDRANAYWIERYGIDGYRFDLSKGFTQRNTGTDVAAWGRYDQSRVDNLTRMADAIWNVDPNAHIILEHFADNPEEQVLVNYGRDEGKPGMMVWTKMVSTFNEATMGYHDNGKSNTAGAYTGQGGRGFSNTGSVAILEDHDEQRLMRKNLLFGNTGPNGYTVKDQATATQRMGTAAAFLFTLPGPKMVWQWGELGYGFPNDECLPEQDNCPGGRTSNRGLGWDYLETKASRDLYDTWSNLINLRTNHAVFTDFDTNVTLDTGRPNGTKRIVLRGDTMDAVVLGNFGTADQTIGAGLGGSGTWYDYFSGQTATASGLDAGVQLAPGEFRVYTSRDIGTATFTSTGDAISSTALTLGTPAPNPVAATSRLAFSLDRAGSARLDVFDTLGRLVTTVVDAHLSAGPHEAILDASSLASGLYVLRLTTGDATLTSTFIRAGR